MFSLTDDLLEFAVDLKDPVSGARRTVVVTLTDAERIDVLRNARLADDEGLGPVSRAHAMRHVEGFLPGFRADGDSVRRVVIH